MSPGLQFVFRAEVSVAPPLVVGHSSRVAVRRGMAARGPLHLPAADGALIQVVNRALRHGPPAVMERIFRGETVGPDEYCFRTVAEFEAPVGPHDWLNKGIFVSIAERRRDAAIVRFHRVT